jgi:5'-deoxynucleotidase YfbR-like HD superfamily hydrolase
VKLLGQYEERLSTVKRWGIVRTIQQQSVAEHSFRVALIADRLAILWTLGAVTEDGWRRFAIQRYALLHDQYESFTGDLPTPAGKRIDKAEVEGYFGKCVNEQMAYDDEIKAIVKAADYAEALVFLAVETNLGNNGVARIFNDVCKNMLTHLIKWDKADLYEVIINEMYTYVVQDQDPLT